MPGGEGLRIVPREARWGERNQSKSRVGPLNDGVRARFLEHFENWYAILWLWLPAAVLGQDAPATEH